MAYTRRKDTRTPENNSNNRNWTQYFATEERGLTPPQIAARRELMKSVIGRVGVDTFSCLHNFPPGFVIELNYPAFTGIRGSMSAPNSVGIGRVLLNEPSKSHRGYRDVVIIQRTVDPEFFMEFFHTVAPMDEAFYGAGRCSLLRKGFDPMEIDYDAFLKEVGL